MGRDHYHSLLTPGGNQEVLPGELILPWELKRERKEPPGNHSGSHQEPGLEPVATALSETGFPRCGLLVNVK